jgi:hypothetical protein
MIDRKLCKGGFTYFPTWRCPACGQGALEREQGMVKHWPAKGVYEAIEEGHIPRWDDYGVFSATLKCSNRSCKQGVAVLGDYLSRELDYPQMAYEHQYAVLGVHPALLLIDVPPATPGPIADALLRSFGLFWADAQACAGAIRVAIEGIAEHLGEPPEVAGKFVSLGRRLKKLAAKHPDVVEATNAIKDIGNDGAHGKDIDRDKLLSCYELLEIELRTLFGDDPSRRRTLIDSLRK